MKTVRQLCKKERDIIMDNKIIKQTAYELFGIGAGPEDAKSGKRAAQPAPQPAKPVQTAPAAAPAPVKPAASYLAPGTVLEGQLRSEGDLELAGSFKGSITTNGSIMLRANTKSTVSAGNLNLSGCTLDGDVTVTGTVTVSEDSRINGNVTARELQCAGEITGDLNISGNTTLEEKARINGSVVTGTMSVARGAAICGSVEMGKKAAKKQQDAHQA